MIPEPRLGGQWEASYPPNPTWRHVYLQPAGGMWYWGWPPSWLGFFRTIGAGLSNTTAYQATVYRLSVVPIRDNQASFPLILQAVLCHIRPERLHVRLYIDLPCLLFNCSYFVTVGRFLGQASWWKDCANVVLHPFSCPIAPIGRFRYQSTNQDSSIEGVHQLLTDFCHRSCRKRNYLNSNCSRERQVPDSNFHGPS